MNGRLRLCSQTLWQDGHIIGSNGPSRPPRLDRWNRKTTLFPVEDIMITKLTVQGLVASAVIGLASLGWAVVASAAEQPTNQTQPAQVQTAQAPQQGCLWQAGSGQTANSGYLPCPQYTPTGRSDTGYGNGAGYREASGRGKHHGRGSHRGGNWGGNGGGNGTGWGPASFQTSRPCGR